MAEPVKQPEEDLNAGYAAQEVPARSHPIKRERRAKLRPLFLESAKRTACATVPEYKQVGPKVKSGLPSY